MKEVDELIKKHEDALDIQYVSKNYERCEKYVAIHNDWSKTQIELAEEHNVSQSLVGYWRSSYEQGLVRVLRSLEEDSIIQEWAKIQKNEDLSEAARNYAESMKETTLEPLRPDFSEAKKIEPKDVKEGLGNITEAQLDHERLVKGFEKMYPKDREDERIFHSNLSTVYSSDELKTLEESLRQNKELVETELKRRLGLEHTENIVKVANVEGRMYMWIQDQSKNDMLNAWANQYFYPKDSRELARMTDSTLDKLGLSPQKTESIEHYNKIMDQLLSETDSSKI
ncbi:MAG: hypothetical protein P1Q69_00840 [Candidatus Thorarchaeota archaeon]|nr:hypothetical protein [Candidatus Thorarchaeota archaeon]